MKKLSIFLIACIGLIGLYSCESEDDVVFVIEPADSVAFVNNFASEYVLTGVAAANVGERFVWNSVDFGEPTNITYELQRANSSDFSSPTVVAATSGNEIAVTIGDLLGFAAELGLDADPLTDDKPNTGTLYFRLRAFAGSGGVEVVSSAQAMVLVLPETAQEAVCEFDQLWLVGAGITDAGWGWDNPIPLNCTGNGVYSGNVYLKMEDGNNFRFFTVRDDWGSGRNFPHYEDAGYTIDANFENAQDGDSNFGFIGTSGLYYLEVDDINKTITLSAPQALGTCEFDQLWIVGAGVPDAGWGWDSPVQLVCEGESVYAGYVTFSSDGDANFRFFTTRDDWGSGRNFPHYADGGYTIDANFENAQDGDSNFKFVGASGRYYLVIDDINKVITLE